MRGATRPRVEVRPPFVSSFGPAAIELASLAGLELDFWQQQALTLMLASREDGKWACFEYGEIVARQNGKGGILEARALAGLFLLGEQLIMWSAHEYKTAMEAFLRVQNLIGNLVTVGEIERGYVKVIGSHGEEGFEIEAAEATEESEARPGQRLKFIARSKSSGRGFSGDVNIIDEAFAYTPTHQAALMPTMNARENPQIIYTSSPPLDSDSGEVLFSLRARAEAGGDDSLGWRDWGLAGDLDNLDKIDMDDRRNWAATNPALGIRITEETIVRLRRSMASSGGAEFAREILGVWPKRREGGGAIDVARWLALADAESKRQGAVAVAVDISPKRDYAAIGLYGIRDDEVGHVQLVHYQAGTAWIVPKLVEIRKALDPIAYGMGRGTYTSLKTELTLADFVLSEDLKEPEHGELAVTTATDMSAACGQFLDAVRDGTFRHIGQAPLDASVAGAKTREGMDSIAWTRKDADADTCPLVSVTVARWAYDARAHLIEDYDVMESFY